jgi:hypothetical protein
MRLALFRNKQQTVSRLPAAAQSALARHGTGIPSAHPPAARHSKRRYGGLGAKYPQQTGLSVVQRSTEQRTSTDPFGAPLEDSSPE